MKRLRHPVRAIREPFGTAGLIVACIAIVLALTGAAFAAAGLNGKQKKEVEKIAKKFAGKPGAPGAAGPAGPQGAAGAGGANGKDGTNGTDGEDGVDGKSVQVTAIAAGIEGCEELGGAEVKVQGAGSGVEVCNGAQGEPGKEGSPWTAGGTLPPGATETGAWAFNGYLETIHTEVGGEEETVTVGDAKGIFAPISFAIPLAENENGLAIEVSDVHFQTEPNFSDFDEGGPSGMGCFFSQPPGSLCVYTEFVENATFLGVLTASGGTDGAAPAGAQLSFKLTGGTARGVGSFSVRAPCAAGEEIAEEETGGFPKFNCKEAA